VRSLPPNILADTGPLFALIHARDADHERAVQFAQSFTGHLITTWPVLTEVSYLLEQSDRRGIGILLGMVVDGHLLTADLDAGDVDYMRRLTARYDGMDLADASLVSVGERLGILDVITLDRRDFSRYRTRARQAFTNHFPDRQ
jgi:predicted nucleic acid-binding protein